MPSPSAQFPARPNPVSRRSFLAMSAAGAVGVVLGACGDDDDGAATGVTEGTGGREPSQGRDSATPSFEGITITNAVYAKNHASSPLYWQQFAPDGLTVVTDIYTTPSDMNRAMEAGDLDFALMGPYSTLVEAEQGFTSKIVCMCARRGLGLVFRTDQGIEAIEDLAGKRIAVGPPGLQVLLLSTILAEAGLDLDRDLTAVPLGFADHATALERGDVDAYIGTEPLVTSSILSGAGQRFDGIYDTFLGDFNTAIWASPSMQEQPDLVAAAVRMQRDAAEHLSPGGDNDAEVWHDLLVDQFDYSEEIYAEVLGNIGAVWDFDDDRRAQVQGAAEAMLSSGLLTREPDYESLFLLDFLPES